MPAFARLAGERVFAWIHRQTDNKKLSLDKGARPHIYPLPHSQRNKKQSIGCERRSRRTQALNAATCHRGMFQSGSQPAVQDSKWGRQGPKRKKRGLVTDIVRDWSQAVVCCGVQCRRRALPKWRPCLMEALSNAFETRCWVSWSLSCFWLHFVVVSEPCSSLYVRS